MRNISRTTLRELKKRYLNVLKKCLLANLMAFAFVMPAGAEESFLDKLTQDGTILMDKDETVVLNDSAIITNSIPLTTTKIDTSSKILTFNGSGAITFKDIKLMVDNNGNEVNIAGGALKQRTISFENEGGVNFLDNSISATGNGGSITISSGGLSIAYKPLTITSVATFKQNTLNITIDNGTKAHAKGGAIGISYNTATFMNDTFFEENSVSISSTSSNSRAFAGAFLAGYGSHTFLNGDTYFHKNNVTVNANKGDAYAYGGAISTEELVEITYGDEKDDITEFKNNFVKNINLGGTALGYAGAINYGSHVFNGYSFFENNKVEVQGNVLGFLNAYGGATYEANLTFNNAVSFNQNSVSAINDKGWIDAAGGVIFGGQNTFSATSYFVKNNAYVSSQQSNGYARGGAIYKGTNTFLGNTYFIDNKSEILSVGSYLRAYGGAIYDATAIFDGVAHFQENKTVSNSDFGNIDALGGAIYNSNIKLNNLGLFIKNTSTSTSNTGIVTANGGAIYNDKPIEFNGKTIFMDNTAIGSTLGEIIVEGGAIYNAAAGVVNLSSDFDFSGNKTIKNGVERKNDIYNEGTIKIAGDKETVGVLSGGINGVQVVTQTETETTTKIPQINKSGTGLLVLGDEAENHEYEGTFTQTAGVTIANSEAFFSHELVQNTINGGELKTHGAEIAYKATLGETGTLTHLGTSADTPTEIKGITFNGTGLNLTLGTYTKAEQEKEIALVGDRLVEYVDDKGTEDTADDELVSYQATDKLFTVKALENDQKAKFILNENLTGMEGNSITVAGAELDVKEGLKVAGKVIAKDMRLPAEKTSSFTTLEVAEKGLLDIQNQTVTADILSLNQESTVKVSVHSLSDYGQILAKETVSKGTGTLTMNLVGAPQEGVYQVFESDTDLKLATTHEFFDIADLENGSYKIKRKKGDELAEKFGLNDEETMAVSAVIGGNSENKVFQKVQTEIMETLKSGNKGKAKKALNALGARSTSVYQSQATAQFTQMHTVITQMLMNSTAPIFGHAGGEEPARATVYVKGLYDRVNSLAGDGFRMRSKGAVLGVQSAITEDLTVGIGYAGINSVAKESLRRTEVDTNTGFISAQYQPNNWWVNGVVTYSRSQYDEEKNILSTKGSANYDVDSLGAQITTGYNIKRGNWIVTPEVGVRYLNARQEGYVDSLGTTVEKTTSDFVTTMAGFKVGVDLGWMRPLAGVMVGYDVVTDDISAVNTLANKETYIIKGEALDRLSTTVVAGFAADIADNATLKLEYSGNYRKEYLDHSGMLRLEWRF